MNKLKFVGLAALLLAATEIVAHGAVVYQSITADLILSYQGPSTTNSHNGQIKDVKESVHMTTPQLVAILASNLGVTPARGASIVKATTFAEGVDFEDIVTNATTLGSNMTLITSNFPDANEPFGFPTNTIPTATVFQTNGGTNIIILPGLYAVAPSNYSSIGFTNYVTNIVEGKAYSVAVGTNVQYYLNNGSGLNAANLIPIGETNSNAGGSAYAYDDATSFLNNIIYTDDQNYFGDTYGNNGGTGLLTNFMLFESLTNTAGVFAGTVDTNFKISGTFYGDYISLNVGPATGAAGTNTVPSTPYLSIHGYGDATANTSAVGSGKSALPATTWNGTFDVNGGGSLGGVITNNGVNTNFVYVSGSTTEQQSPGFYYYNGTNYIYTSPTNPPLSFTNAKSILIQTTNGPAYTNIYSVFTDVGTNYYTNFILAPNSATNTSFTISGTVREGFLKLVQ